jgi:hypothetical protein
MMSTFHRVLRIALRLLLCVATLCVLLLGAIQIHQHILRAHAERLYGEIISLALLKTPGADAVRTLSHWGNAVQRAGNCESGTCSLTISGKSWMVRHGEFFGQHLWLVMHYPWIGGRNLQFGAEIDIRDGLVSRKSFGLMVVNITPPEMGRRYLQYRAGGFNSVSSFRDLGPICDLLMQNHPEYCVENPRDCRKCTSEYVYFTPFASSSDVARITQFDFGCMTRWSPCEKIRDVMPAAAAEYESEERKWASLPKPAEDEGPGWYSKAAWINARETKNVVIAEVTSIGRRQVVRQSPDTPYLGASLRVIERLKGAKDWTSDQLRDLSLRTSYPIRPPETRAPVHPGARFIVMYDEWYKGGPLFVYPYGVLPLNDANLADVRFGISRDYEAGFPKVQ